MACAPAYAQTAVDVRGTVGVTGFGDEGIENHLHVGGSARFYVTQKLGIEPEFQFLSGSGSHRDYVFVGNLSYDFRSRRARIVPYVIGGVGVISVSFGGTDEFLDVGGGAKFYLDDRWFIAPEFRLGWQPHIRFTVSLGRSWR